MQSLVFLYDVCFSIKSVWFCQSCHFDSRMYCVIHFLIFKWITIFATTVDSPSVPNMHQCIRIQVDMLDCNCESQICSVIFFNLHEEILNSFLKPYEKKKLLNSFTEIINSKIKTYLAVSKGISTFHRSKNVLSYHYHLMFIIL